MLKTGSAQWFCYFLLENCYQYLPYYRNGHVGKNFPCGIFWRPPWAARVRVCVFTWSCQGGGQSVVSGPSLVSRSPPLHSSPMSCFPPFLHTSELQNVHFLGSECALGGPGVNQHFVTVRYSLSRLSRCVSGKRSWEVTKRLRCFWQQSGVFQRALSSVCVFWPKQSSDWLKGCSPHATQVSWLH